MTLKVDLGSISNALSKIGSEERSVRSIAQTGSKTTALSAFSSVSGLDQLGSGHSQIISGGVGAANSVLNSYAEQIEWLKAGLEASS